MGLEKQKNALLEKLAPSFKYPLHKLRKGESASFKYHDRNAFANEFTDTEKCDVNPEVLIRYLILMYTKGSPAVEQHPENIGKRKTYVMELLGFEPDEEGKYVEEGLNEMLRLRGEGIRQKFALFLSIQQSSEWAILCHAWESLEAIFTHDVKPTDPDEILKQQKAIHEIRENIRRSYESLTVGDKSKALEEAIEYFRAHRGLMLRPEETIYEDEKKTPIEPSKQKWPTNLKYND